MLDVPFFRRNLILLFSLVQRFLEQVSFGPSRQTLDEFSGTMAEWVKNQQEMESITSHREYYRQRTNDRVRQTSSTGVPTHPCQKGARYRRYAFVQYDEWKTVDLITDSVTGRKVLYRDGQARTVLDMQQVFVGTGANAVELPDRG